MNLRKYVLAGKHGPNGESGLFKIKAEVYNSGIESKTRALNTQEISMKNAFDTPLSFSL